MIPVFIARRISLVLISVVTRWFSLSQGVAQCVAKRFLSLLQKRGLVARVFQLQVLAETKDIGEREENWGVVTGAGCENIYSTWVKYHPRRVGSTSFHGSRLSGWTPRHFLATLVVVSSSRNGQTVPRAPVPRRARPLVLPAALIPIHQPMFRLPKPFHVREREG
jgi:hypothetical protein